ncbi:Hypothetical protein SCF082_LOCUS11214 [Durusdinium trenchii]|uniref:Uncharacterized protein n=1 Tax=Durusdinium trenchii TaxID=1381693 RepID=A0ABP0JBP3_9DINO
MGNGDRGEGNGPSPVVVPMAMGGGSDKKRGGGTRIRVVQQPDETFYKDEGGKANHMLTVIRVDGLKKLQRFGGKVVINPRLCYESGAEVEDGDEIFKVMGIEPKAVVSADQDVVVKFRIEKVSRRKDGQRFKVWFDTEFDSIAGCYTSPVTVLSKRKFTSQNQRANGNALKNRESPKRARSASASLAYGRRGSHPVTKAEVLSAEAVATMRQALRVLETKVVSLSDRVLVLEKENADLKRRCIREDDTEVAEEKEDEIDMDEYQPHHHHHQTLMQPCISKFHFATADCDPVTDDFMNTFSEPPVNRVGIKSFPSTELDFNFGLPSGAEHHLL